MEKNIAGYVKEFDVFVLFAVISHLTVEHCHEHERIHGGVASQIGPKASPQ